MQSHQINSNVSNTSTAASGSSSFLQIVEGPLSKWTNMVQGWQCRWFVLDQTLGLLSYYTSKQKMKLGVRRGCIRLLHANLGLDDEDQNIFTITDLSNEKTFHFLTKDSDERTFWLKHLEECIQLHAKGDAAKAVGPIINRTSGQNFPYKNLGGGDQARTTTNKKLKDPSLTSKSSKKSDTSSDIKSVNSFATSEGQSLRGLPGNSFL